MRPQHFASRRSATLARHGMVATSQPLAATAGLRVLMDGGSAADASVTVAAMLNVVEPMSTGVGGDCFALVYDASTGSVAALNGSGRSPKAFALEEAQRRKLTTVPMTGPLSVTVPGALSGWSALLERFGTMSLADCLSPAIATAEDGFAVTERISAAWQNAAGKLAGDPSSARTYLPAPGPGELHRQPDLARTLREISEGGEAVFYRGRLGADLAGYVQSLGGYVTTEDLAAHAATWSAPIRTSYRNVEVLEHPPNGQGVAALVALNILEGYPIAQMEYFDPARWHLMIEAMRLGMADARRFVGDPSHTPVPVDGLLAKGYAAERRACIRPDRSLALALPGLPEGQDTAYLTVVDRQGNAVSFINSLYSGFGAGLVVPRTGICLQNRGAGFSLEPGHPNVLASGKRPYHTIIPAIALRQGRLWLSFGVMGGFMQPQGHVQVLVNLVDYDMDPQAALDAPRFRVDECGGPRVAVESGVPPKARKALLAKGHEVQPMLTFSPDFGGGQVIAVDPKTGVLCGGSDPRKDGCAVGF